MSNGRVMIEELLYDIEVLTKRNEMLARDCKVLTDELALARVTMSSSSHDLEEDFKCLRQKLENSRLLSMKLYLKYDVVKHHLAVWRSNLDAIRLEMEKGISRVKSCITSGIATISKALEQKESEISAMRADKKLCLERFYAYQATAELEKACLITCINEMKAEQDNTKQFASREAESLLITLEESKKERLVLIEQHTDSVRAFVESQKAVEVLGKELNDLREDAKVMRAKLEFESSENITFRRENEDLKILIQLGVDQHTNSMEETKNEKEKCNEILLALESVQSELKKTIFSKDCLQSEMTSLLRKEDSLKRVMGVSGESKQNMENRLQIIQNKVRTIEREHLLKMSELEAKLIENEVSKSVLLDLQFQSVQGNCHLERKVQDLLLNNADLTQQIREIQDLSKITENSSNDTIQKLISELSGRKAELEKSEKVIGILRNDRENENKEYEKKNLLLTSRLNTAELLLKNMTEEKESASINLLKFNLTHSTQNEKEFKELKKSLQLAQQTATEKENEVFNLKEIIRRECEERIQNKLVISSLQERLMSNSELLNSSSFGVVELPFQIKLKSGGQYPCGESTATSRCSTQSSSSSSSSAFSSPQRNQSKNKTQNIVDNTDKNTLSTCPVRGTDSTEDNNSATKGETATWLRLMRRKPARNRSRKPSCNN
jgi:hypothetical protein